ncbi:GNAT family N-acetyltransferase [Sphingomonas morindae]|uniref:GNAT family N-acetyltransferase n=1 Tax=Sphingomonas morindae TaxID=1541170 RepID=A0ABY4X5G3_9SPHN|nr:GNAT family N-acetyltransferase [Sphingomonas morindae]USI72116.1 GNAT family N-acetyltransferase [Sphingomonas morindae]
MGEWLDLETMAAPALARPRPLFERLDWFRLVAAHDPALAPRVLRVTDGGEEAFLFLADQGRRRAAPLACWYSLAFAPIGPDRLLPALFAAAATRFDRLTLLPVRADRRAALIAGLRAAGWRVLLHRQSTRWLSTLEGVPFDAYWAARPGRLRTLVARRARSHPVRIEILDRFAAPAWQAYEAVYRASWKPEEGAPALLRTLAAREGAAGTLRLGLAWRGDQPVAAQFWLVEGGEAVIHKLAHREDQRAGSPGTLLSHALFRHVIDVDRVRRIDFGLGDEPYKGDWLDRAEPVWRLDAYRPLRPRGAAGLVRALTGRLARRAGLR